MNIKIIDNFKLGNYIVHPKMYYFLLFSITIYPILFIFQCGDLTDLGYYTYNYSTFQELLKEGRTNTSFFLTNIIGSLWLKIFPHLGILGLKILYLFFLYLIQFISYSFLKRIINNRLIILITILVVEIFSERWLMLAFQYDISSWFFMLISMIFLCNFLTNSKRSYLFLSGMIFALAVLAKISSVSFLLFLPLILIYKSKVLNIYSFKIITLDFFLFTGAFLISLILFVTITETLDVYINFLPFSKNSSISNSYNFKTLLFIYISDFSFLLITIVIVCSFILFCSILFKNKKYFGTKTSKYLLYLFLFLSLEIYFYSDDFSFFNPVKYLMPALCLPPLFYSIITKDNLSNIALVFTIASVSQVLGTNTGIFLKMGIGYYILLPISLTMILNNSFIIIKNMRINIKESFLVSLIFISGVSFISRIGWIYNVDEGLNSRFNAVYPINNPLMKGIFTTKSRSILIQKTSEKLDSVLDKSNRHLFIYGHQPLFYYLTSSICPIDNIWLWNNCTEIKLLLHQLKNSSEKNESWPIILDTNEKILGDSSQILFDKFLIENKFKIVVNDPLFKIWAPQE